MAALPTASDVVAALASAGITLSEAGAEAPLATALELWESATGYTPFVASDTASASPLYVPSSGLHRVIGLGGGVLTVGTHTLTLDESELEAGVDYQLCPVAAPRSGKPYTYLQLLKRPLSIASGVLSLTARWGFCADDNVPPLASGALIARAALEAAAPILQATALEGGAVQKLDQGTVQIQYGTTMTERTQALAVWEKTWADGVKAYARNRVT